MGRYLKILKFGASLWLILGAFSPSLLAQGPGDEDLNYRYEGERSSLIRWDELKTDDWLDLNQWKNERAVKDQYPEWRITLREQRLHEEVGRVIECVGNCRLYRGSTESRVDYRSLVTEGDEIRTLEGSYLWIFLFDGTLVRLSPESSLTFKEINIGKTQVFHHARINRGNILWLSRLPLLHKEISKRETDQIFFPLNFWKANPPPPQTPPKEFQVQDLLEAYERTSSLSRQVMRLNRLIRENQRQFELRDSYAFLVLPNGTIEGENPLLEFIVFPGGKSYIKQRSPEDISLRSEKNEDFVKDLTFHYRGFENEKTSSLIQGSWQEISPRGRRISLAEEKSEEFYFGELLSKRIPSLMVARELWIEKYGEIFDAERPRQLAKKGYRMWGAKKTEKSGETDLDLRKQFLREYTRRFETYHLTTLKKYHQKLQERGEELPNQKYSNRFYRKAFDKYVLRGLGRGETFESDRKILNSEQRKLWKKIHLKR